MITNFKYKVLINRNNLSVKVVKLKVFVVAYSTAFEKPSHFKVDH